MEEGELEIMLQSADCVASRAHGLEDWASCSSYTTALSWLSSTATLHTQRQQQHNHTGWLYRWPATAPCSRSRRCLSSSTPRHMKQSLPIAVCVLAAWTKHFLWQAVLQAHPGVFSETQKVHKKPSCTRLIYDAGASGGAQQDPLETTQLCSFTVMDLICTNGYLMTQVLVARVECVWLVAACHNGLQQLLEHIHQSNS